MSRSPIVPFVELQRTTHAGKPPLAVLVRADLVMSMETAGIQERATRLFLLGGITALNVLVDGPVAQIGPMVAKALAEGAARGAEAALPAGVRVEAIEVVKAALESVVADAFGAIQAGYEQLVPQLVEHALEKFAGTPAREVPDAKHPMLGPCALATPAVPGQPARPGKAPTPAKPAPA